MDNQNKDLLNQDILAEKQAELEKRELELAEREADVEVKEEQVKKGLRDNLYSRINVSLKTMNIIIGCLVAVLVIALVAGIIGGL